QRHDRTPSTSRNYPRSEDEVLGRMPISQYLRDCGYRVIDAANAQEAVTVLSYEETVVDGVFTDIEMPGALDGFGLAKWVREHRPGVEVILAGTLGSPTACPYGPSRLVCSSPCGLE